MKQSETEMRLKILCLEIASRVELDSEVEFDMERMFFLANKIYNHAHRWGYMDMTSVFKKPEIDMNASYKNQLAAEEKSKKTMKVGKTGIPEVEIKDEEEASKKIEPPYDSQFEPCGLCGEMIPKTWNQKHAYKKNGERCGHNI